MNITELLKQAIMSTGNKGTDDDIPAYLSEGEYVFPADIVSKLGKGNTDAGGEVLDMLMEFIRGLE